MENCGRRAEREPILGIDFGTHKSTIAYMDGNQPKTIPDEKGHNFVPSIVSISQDNRIHVGWDAIELPPSQIYTAKTVRIGSIKRLLGQSEEINWGSYRTYPQEISALILRKLKLQAEAYLRQKVTDVVVAVPAHFGVNQRTATIQAAKAAGLNPLRLINEATAAAVAYGFGRSKKDDETLVVFDFGGGTFDVSILDISHDDFWEVLAASGKTKLGGVDIDLALANYLADEFIKTNAVDLRNDPVAWRRIVEAAEKAKCDLSAAVTTVVEVPYIMATQKGPGHLRSTISRQILEEVAKDVFVGIEEICKRVLQDALQHRSVSHKIQRVLLVGNSSHMPKAKQIAQSVFGIKPSMLVDPTEAVGHGAAIQAAVLSGSSVVEKTCLLDVFPQSLNYYSKSGVSGDSKAGILSLLMNRNTTIPSEKYDVFSVELPPRETRLKVGIYEGERVFVRDSVFIGEIVLDGFEPGKKYDVEIQVSINANATAEVFLLSEPDNRESGKKQVGRPPSGRHSGITIQSPYQLNDAQLSLLTRKVAAVLQS